MLPQECIQSPEVYPSLDLTFPPIPYRSRFYALPPIGIGTPYVESLTSYMCRLTAVHSVSFGSFYEYILVPALNKAYLTSPSKVGPASTLIGSFRARMKNINGIGKLAREWSELLETLVLRSDLQLLTLTRLSHAIPHWKLLRTFQAWCPSCYEEMLQSKKTIYQPLLWAIAAVDVCIRHRRPLVERCPYCNKQLLPLWRRGLLGYCARCGYWLGAPPDAQTTVDSLLGEEEIAWRLFVANNIGDMLAALPNMTRPITAETVVKSLNECILISTGGVVAQFAKLIRKPQITIFGWRRKNIRIPLYELLRICYCLDLSILDFLGGADAVRKKGINVRELPDIACTFTPPRSPKVFNSIKVETELKIILDLVPPISFAEASRRIKINVGDLNRKFPELCRKISSRYRDYRQDFYRRERAKVEEEVRQAVIHLYSQGIYVSPRPVAKYLNKPSYIGRRDVAAIIRNTREMLDSEKKAG